MIEVGLDVFAQTDSSVHQNQPTFVQYPNKSRDRDHCGQQKDGRFLVPKPITDYRGQRDQRPRMTQQDTKKTDKQQRTEDVGYSKPDHLWPALPAKKGLLPN